ncbi:nucleotide-binding protein [Thermococcus peptonophilus]
MKILVSGKGGCGKSTISAMLGKYLAEKATASSS